MRRIRKSWALVSVFVCVLAAASVTTGTAFAGKAPAVSGNCDWMNTPLPTPFAPWDDFGQYFLISGGDFEGDLTGWTLNDGATTVFGNDSYQLGSPSDSHSLLLPNGASVTTPEICVTAQSPDLRLAELNTGAKDAKLQVFLNFTDDKGNPRTQKLKDLRGDPSWTLTNPLKFLGPVNNILKRNGQTTVSFTFSRQRQARLTRRLLADRRSLCRSLRQPLDDHPTRQRIGTGRSSSTVPNAFLGCFLAIKRVSWRSGSHLCSATGAPRAGLEPLRSKGDARAFRDGEVGAAHLLDLPIEQPHVRKS